jgi:periplasmic divalent cation tolerance protein
MGPVTSLFWHLGEFGQGEEWRVVLKTTVDRYPALEAHLIENHPWENPEIVAVLILNAPASYLAWVERTVSSH